MKCGNNNYLLSGVIYEKFFQKYSPLNPFLKREKSLFERMMIGASITTCHATTSAWLVMGSAVVIASSFIVSPSTRSNYFTPPENRSVSYLYL